MTTYTCSGSDHLLQIAALHGSNWADLWTQNRGSLTRNPNILFKGPDLHGGDTLTIPSATSSATACTRPTDRNSLHQVSVPRFFLRLRIVKPDFTPLTGARYSLTLERSAPFTGHTDSRGHIEIPSDRPGHALPVALQRARLQVWAPADTFGPAPSSDTRVLRGDVAMNWDLAVGALNPILEGRAGAHCLSGLQQRLNNLSFECGAITGTMNPQTDAAISAFQWTFGLRVGGRSNPDFEALQTVVRDLHDQPTPTRRPAPLSSRSPSDPEWHPTVSYTPASSTVGHVALDFDPDHPTTDSPRHFNTLMVRPQYRISLEMGKIEDLIPDPADTWKGRAARLQVVGLFYFPLEHARARAALEEGWKWFMKEILRLPSDGRGERDSQAISLLQIALQRRVVSAAARPRWSGALPNGLPPAAVDPQSPQETNFAKIRIPGGYTFMGADANFCPNDDISRYGRDLWFRESEIHRAEQHSYNENIALGKIPLIARVDRWNAARREWEPAPNVEVYFQLVAPYEVPPSSRFSAPPVRSTVVAEYLRTRVNYPPDWPPDDPQAGNVHTFLGGKKGIPVDERIFLCSPLAGFNGPHASRSIPNRTTPADFFPTAEAVARSDPRYDHAVRARTNRHGEAGVVFMPSCCGGDRYRIRAFIDPARDPEGVGGVETGTLVVWRNIRISRFLRHRPRHIHPQLLADAAAELPLSAAEPERTRQYMSRGAFTTEPDGTISGFPEVDLREILRQFATAYCELELDRREEDLTERDWTPAHRIALNHGRVGQVRLALNYDLETLFPVVMSSTPLVPANMDSILPMRTPDTYNRALPAATRATRFSPSHPIAATFQSNDDYSRAVILATAYVIPGLMHSLSKGGFLPGISLLTSTVLTSWEMIWRPANISGYSPQFRMSSGYYGASIHLPPSANYSYTANLLHEMGHLLYRTHAPGRPSDTQAGGVQAGRHQAGYVCVMSYSPCDGDFCGKCLMALRGCVP